MVTKPFQFEGARRMRFAEAGISELQKVVDTLLIIPNQNLFRVANEKTTFADAFAMADQVLYSGVACITDLMVKEGLINLDFADVRAVMKEMGKAMMGTGEASGEKRALTAAEAAIANPLIDDASMKGARGLLISITGGKDLTLYEVDEAATRIREEVDQDANIIVGATFDESLEGIIRVSVVATGIDQPAIAARRLRQKAALAELTSKVRGETKRIAERIERAAPRRRHQHWRRCARGGCRGDLAADGARRRVDPSDADEAVAVRTAGGISRHGRGPAPGGIHSAGCRTHDCAYAAHAAHRRVADSGTERNAGTGRRASGRSSGKTTPVADAAFGRGRARPSRGSRRRHRRRKPSVRPCRRSNGRSGRPRGQPEGRPADPVSEYARRAGPQGLDPHGRSAAVHNPGEDDQLDIPAFLRRQAN